MPDPALLAALFLLAFLVESSPYVRLPIGLVLAIGAVSGDLDVLPVAAVGTLAMLAVRLTLALRARGGRSRRRGADAQRDALRSYLTNSPSYSRITFFLSALPGVPSTFLFPLLGAMRAPLAPAVAGTIVGRLPILVLTTAIFVWAGELLAGDSDDPAIALGVFAVIMLVVRTIGLVDWAHRSQTGKWRLRDPDAGMLSGHPMFGAQPTPGAAPFRARPPQADVHDDDDIVEGELLGEEIDDDPAGGDEAPREAPGEAPGDRAAGDPSDPRSIDRPRDQ